MAEHALSEHIGRRVSLTGHFDVPVVLEDVRPLRHDLEAIHTVYPDFQVEIDGDVLWLKRSPPPVPFRKVIHSFPEQTV